VATADKTFGPGPLTVQFSGSASSDPQGRPLTYEWNFGDQTALNTEANPLHVFQATGNTPVGYTITLKVTNDLGQSSTALLRISLNNTPPSVTITSLASTNTYPVTVDTTVALSASVSDAEQGPAGLRYAWQVILHHNNHVHKGPIDTKPSTWATLAPVGCDGEEYYYSITLTVTDELGLSASDQVILLPNCLPNANVSNLRAHPASTRVGLNWTLPSQAAKAGNAILSLSTGVEESDDQRMKLFPNPAQETFWVRLIGYPQVRQVQFRLFNQTGQSVLERTEAHGEGSDHLLSVQHLPSGLYLLQIRVGSQWGYKKVLLIR
jgi:hypothetical protein